MAESLRKKQEERQKSYDDFMDSLRGMPPDDLLNFYIEANYGKNFIAEDKLPIAIFRKAQEAMQDMLDILGPKMN